MKREPSFLDNCFKRHPRTMQEAFGAYATCNFEQPAPRFVDKVIAYVLAIGSIVAICVGVFL